MPAFDWKMHQIFKNSLYRCHNTLVSVHTDQVNQILNLHFFTTDKKESIWILKEDWDHKWRHHHGNAFFGGAHRKDLTSNVKILLTNGQYC